MTEAVPQDSQDRAATRRRLLRRIVVTVLVALLALAALAAGGVWYLLHQMASLSADPRPSREHVLEVARDVALDIPPSAVAQGLWVRGIRDHTIYMLLTVPRSEVAGFVGQKLLRGKLQPGPAPQVPREVQRRWPASGTAGSGTWQSFDGPVPYQKRPEETWWLRVDVQSGDATPAIVYVVVTQT